MHQPRSGRVRRALVTAIGGTVLATGIVLMPLPGPGTLIVAGGLSILSREYPAAGRVLDRVKRLGRNRPGVAAVGPDHPAEDPGGD